MKSSKSQEQKRQLRRAIRLSQEAADAFRAAGEPSLYLKAESLSGNAESVLTQALTVEVYAHAE